MTEQRSEFLPPHLHRIFYLALDILYPKSDMLDGANDLVFDQVNFYIWWVPAGHLFRFAYIYRTFWTMPRLLHVQWNCLRKTKKVIRFDSKITSTR
jgi:hypothetical protein